MEKLLTAEFWATYGAFVFENAALVIPLLLLALLLGWLIKGALDGREIRGAAAEKNAAEQRLKLATEKEAFITPAITKLEFELGMVKRQMENLSNRNLPEVPQLVSSVNATTATMHVVSTANTELRGLLSPKAATEN
jgi:hypothetical protein